MVNVFVSNPLVFSFESQDENYFYGVTIISSSFPTLKAGTTLGTIHANWAYNFVGYNLENPKEPEQKSLREIDMPWS